MNFDNIKSALENEDQAPLVPESLATLKKSEMPIQQIRKTMKGEIITQLICIVIFFAAPSFMKLHQFPRAVYYIFMFLTALMTMGYVTKMIWFLRKTGSIQGSTKETLLLFIHDIQLTLEVYKTAIISGSILLPISVTALLLGSTNFNENLFQKWFLLDIGATRIILLIFGYLITTFFIYIITVKWADSLYVRHIDKLRNILNSLNE